jgi:glucose-1-phosphate cytidylyltransferase
MTLLVGIQTELPYLTTALAMDRVESKVKSEIPVVILAGGKGTRMFGSNAPMPKTLVPVINGKPILWHIINHYAYYGYKKFYVLGGFLVDQITKWVHETNFDNVEVSVFHTGEDTQTGGRIRKIRDLLYQHPFALTYGDGISNVDLYKVWKALYPYSIEGVVTAVHPSARFGKMKLNESCRVEEFMEKPERDGWINGGFFMFNPSMLDLIDGDDTVLERDVLPYLATEGLLYAHKHEGFWTCIDTPADLEYINSLKYVPLPYLNNR